jgi:very-short-patch-repair endonuclease
VSIPGPVEQRAASIANLQRGRVSRWQLLEAEVPSARITRMLGAGWLLPRRSGVYAVGHLAPVELARETESLLAVGWGAVLGALPALAVWRLRPPLDDDHPVDVTVADHRRVRDAGIRVHRTIHLDRRDVRIERGLPVVSPARAYLDVAGAIREDELEQLLDDGLSRGIVRLGHVREVLDRAGRGRPGAGILARLLDDRTGTRSVISRSRAERILRGLLRRSRLPPPEMNQPLLGYFPDMMWPEAKLIVEVDSWEFHGDRGRFEADRRRDVALAAHGWLTLRFTARRIEREPLAVLAEIALMLGRRLEQHQRAA